MRCLWRSCLGLLERGAHGDRDQVLLGHQLADRLVEVLLEAQVAVGEDADQVAVVVGDRHARDLVARHDLERLADALLGPHGDRVDDHAGLAALHLVDLVACASMRQVLVDDADAALLRQGDGQAGLGDGVHRRRDDRDVERDPAAERGAQVDLVGMDLGEARDGSETSSKVRASADRDRACAPEIGERIAEGRVRATEARPRGRVVRGARRALVATVTAPVALLVLLARAAGAGIVAADLGACAARPGCGCRRRPRRRLAAARRAATAAAGSAARCCAAALLLASAPRVIGSSWKSICTMSSSMRSIIAWKSSKLSRLYSMSGSRWP